MVARRIEEKSPAKAKEIIAFAGTSFRNHDEEDIRYFAEQYKDDSMVDYPERVNFFIEKYSSLVQYTEQLIFPKYRRELPKDSIHWGWYKKTVHKLSHPLSLSQGALGEMAWFFILMFLSQANLGWGVMFLAPALFHMPSMFSSSVFTSIMLAILATIFALPLVSVTYYWWYLVFTSKQYRTITRLILIAVEMAFVWGFGQAIKSSSPSARFINTTTDIIPLVISFLLFLIPSISYLLLIGTEIIGQFLQLITALSHDMQSMHDPLPLKQVKLLSINEIPGTDEKPAWKLQALSLHEIQALRKWAEANRESTDKRTLPTIVVFGFLALFLSSETIKQAITEPIIRSWWGCLTFFWYAMKSQPGIIFSWRYLGATFVLVITLTIAVSLLKMFSRLFRNLAVQSLIIETCILAENSHVENYLSKEIEAHDPQKKGSHGLFQELANFLHTLFTGESKPKGN